MKNIEKMI